MKNREETKMCEKEIEIVLNSSCFEGQSSRLITELNLSKEEAENVSKTLRDLIKVKLKEQDKNWSKSARESFVNLMIAMFIEEAKVLNQESSNKK